MKKQIAAVVFLFTALTLAAISCKHEPQYAVKPTASAKGTYPKEIGDIILNRCATSGCHNEASYKNAAGLRMDTWDALFDGANSGAVVVPYSPANSSLLYFVNTDPARGPVSQPTMPLNAAPLTDAEYTLMRDWIARGAPDTEGNIPFGSEASTRQKIYLTQQGCDAVAVIDAARRVVMRYIPIGVSLGIEAPHFMRVSNDGRYAYVSFLGGTVLQKIDTDRDTVVGTVDIGSGSWNAFGLSHDGKRIMLNDFANSGKIIFVDAERMVIERTYNQPGLFYSPHGVAGTRSWDTLFVTGQYGNTVYKISFTSGLYKQVSIDGAPPTGAPGRRDPHEILMAPDFSKYFLSCEASNEIRVIDARTDAVLAAIPVGIKPQELAISTTKPYLFVTCMEDNNALTGFKGSVYVINYHTYDIVKRIDGRFYQPHGVSVDDQAGTFFIGSRNANQDGPAPHHASQCGGRNGFYSVYELNTLEPAGSGRRYEVLPEPYSMDVRFN